MKFRVFTFILCVFAGIYAGPSMAVTPTPEQLQMLQNLTPAQQQALASQYGVSLSSLPAAMGLEEKQSIELDPTIMHRKAADMALPFNHIAQKKMAELEDDGVIKPFGYDIFEGAPTSFSPIGDLPVPGNYIIAPGDEINVQLYGKENESHTFMVGRDGQIEFPKIGPINVAGQEFAQLKLFLAEEVRRKILGVQAHISLGELRAMPVFVLGDAYQPGAYTLSSMSTISQALMASGGIRPIGSLRNIQLKRQGEIITRLDLYDFLLNGNTENDIRMQDGDSIFIPAKGDEITVAGKVRRPAIYELRGKTTLAEALRMAGGLLADSYKQDIAVKRFTESGIEIFNFNMDDADSGNFALENGDEIEVKENSQQIQFAIEIKGEVNYPGRYKWFDGIRVSDLLSSIDDDLKQTTELSYALVIREINVKGDVELHQFDLAKAILEPSSEENMLLNQDDKILIFSTLADDEESEQTEPEEEIAEGDEASPSNENHSQSNNTATHSKAFYAQVDQNTLPEQGLTSNVAGFDQQGENTQEDEEAAEREKQAKQLEMSKANRRSDLLKPVIAQLAKQASFGHPIKLVEIDGAVRFPGTYPLTQEQMLSDLLVAAGGVKESANLSTGELSRVNAQGSLKLSHIPIKMEDVVLGKPNADIELRSKDRVLVFNTPDWEIDHKITLKGEVRFPGTYSINRGELLGDVIKRAGGLTKFANPNGAIFSREELKEREKQELERLHEQLKQEIASMTLRRQNRVSQLTSSPSEALKVVNKLSDVRALGRLVINLESILEGVRNRDIELENGDMLYIPPLRKTVTIVGQVQSPSTHYFEDNISVTEYINLAGGMKKQADSKRVYIVHADGSVSLPKKRRWFSRDAGVALGPSDTIVVPLDTDYTDSLSTWAIATQMVYQLGVAWNAIND